MAADGNADLWAWLINLVFVTGLAGVVWVADRYARQPLWLALSCFLWGAIVVPLFAPCLFPEAPMLGELLRPAIDRVLWIPLAEEGMKVAPVVLLALLPTVHADRPAGLQVAGALIGLGTAMAENSQRFVEWDTRQELLQGGRLFGRLIIGPLMHGGTVALVGLGLGWTGRAPRPVTRLCLPAVAFALAVLWHGLANSVNLTAWSGAPDFLFALSSLQVTVIQYVLALSLGAVVVLALCRELRVEQAALVRFAEEAPQEARLPAELIPLLPSWRQRWRATWSGPRRVRRRLVRLASQLAILTAHLDASGGQRPGLARRVERLRQRLAELVAAAARAGGTPRAKADHG